MSKRDCMYQRFQCMNDVCDNYLKIGLDEPCWSASEDYYEDCKMVLPAGDCMHFKQDLNAECNCFRKFRDMDECWENCRDTQRECETVLNRAICHTY